MDRREHEGILRVRVVVEWKKDGTDDDDDDDDDDDNDAVKA
jgi:hypothetical protein